MTPYSAFLMNIFCKLHIVQMKRSCRLSIVIHLLKIEFLRQHFSQRGIEDIHTGNDVIVMRGQFGAEVEEIVDRTADRQQRTFFGGDVGKGGCLRRVCS